MELFRLADVIQLSVDKAWDVMNCKKMINFSYQYIVSIYMANCQLISSLIQHDEDICEVVSIELFRLYFVK